MFVSVLTSYLHLPLLLLSCLFRAHTEGNVPDFSKQIWVRLAAKTYTQRLAEYGMKFLSYDRKFWVQVGILLEWNQTKCGDVVGRAGTSS